ncbi:MAG: hypothetical protein JJ863_09260 [Deltaproteobacteria bacterium]|nr:hypothetical protein [Deltaproteobacteria bacterium]
MFLEADGRRFELLVASDVSRDGLGVELHELLPRGETRMVMEVFRFDDPTSFDTRPLRTVLTHASNDVPLAVAKVVLDRAVTELTVGGRRD